MKRRHDGNDLDRSRVKYFNGGHGRAGWEKGGATDGTEKGNAEVMKRRYERLPLCIKKVERNREMTDEVHKAKLSTTNDEDDELRKVETDVDGSNVCMRVVERSEREATEDGLICTSTVQIQMDHDMGFYTALLTPCIGTPSQVQLVTHGGKPKTVSVGTGRAPRG